MMEVDYTEDIPGVTDDAAFLLNPFTSNGKVDVDESRGDEKLSEYEADEPSTQDSSDVVAEKKYRNDDSGETAAPAEVWIETRTDTGKSYFYQAVTRETTWDKPVGPSVKIMSQAEVEEMSKQQAEKHDSQATPNMLHQPPPNVGATQPALSQPPPNMHQQPPPMFQPGYGQHPYGMPPPAYGYPGNPAPWGMPPWGQHMPAAPAPQQEQPAKTLIIKPGVIDPAIIARAAEWSEHRAPDGRPYYYHANRGESVWEKPQALRDMEAARMALHGGPPKQPPPVVQPPALAAVVPPHIMQNQMMHIPPVGAATGYDPAVAYAAAAAAAIKASEAKPNAQAAAAEKETKKAAEDKRKREEEQKKAAAAKPVDKSKPVSSTAIAGTPWCVVWTGDGRVFYYNPSSRTSVWERPEELMDREDVDKAIRERPEQLKPLQQLPPQEDVNQKNTTTEVKSKPDQDNSNNVAPVEMTEVNEQVPAEDDDIIKIQSGSDSETDETAAKRPRLATVSRSTRKAEAGEAAMEAEQRAAKERALVPLEKRVAQFKDMLREKDVSAFSTWEKELHKIVFDPRYLLLTSKERKQVFERYVKDRAEEERMEKRNKMRQKREDFRALLEECKLHGRSSFSDFSQRHGKEERYRAIEKLRERENLFNEYLVEVRRREKEERIQRREQIRKDFIDLLRERAGDIDRYTRWHDVKRKFETDARYRAVESSVYREEYFEDYMRIVKEEKRKERELREEREREKERERERERRAEKRDKADRERDRKEKRRDRDRSRSRDRRSKDNDKKEKDKEKEKDKNKDKEKEKENEKEKDKDKDKEKENDMEKKEKNADGEPDADIKKPNEELEDGEQKEEGELSSHSATKEEQQHINDEAEKLQKEQKERDRQLRAEQSIREREKEVQRALAGHLRDRDKEREHHKRDEAIGHFNALLTDLVRNADFTWKEVKKQLRRDHRWELIETLDRELREKLFNDHIAGLMKKKRESFREMLNEISTFELTSHWKDIKKLIRDDPRYLKFSSEKCEREYREYIRDKTTSAKVALRELLQECKFITHKSLELVKENPNHLNEIQDILKKDKRYLILDHMEDDRNKIIKAFLAEMHERGPPPPPTASDSSRRTK